MTDNGPQLGDYAPDVVDGKTTRPIAKDELFSLTKNDIDTIILTTLNQKINECRESLADERVQNIALTADVATLKQENEELNAEKVSLANRLWDDQKRVKELEAEVARLKAGWRTDEEAFTVNVGDKFRSLCHTITDNDIPVERGAVGTVIQVFANSAFLKFEKCGDVFSNDTLRKDFEKLPAEHPLAELTNIIKYWSSPWTPGVWWNEFDDAPRLFRLFDSATNYGKGRWVKIEKPPFTPRLDPLEENVKSIIAELSDVDDLTRDVGAIIKKHFADWEPKE